MRHDAGTPRGDSEVGDRDITPRLEDYWAILGQAVPPFNPDQQRAAVTLYRELAKGQAVSTEQFARALGVPLAEARRVLEREPLKPFIYPDKEGRVLGFGGLAAAPMHHRLTVAGVELWAWCAWDTLFLPEILGERAQVTSPDPETGELVKLVVTPEGVEAVEPDTTVVSFLLPDAEEFTKSASNVMATFCHFVFFFASRESGERWVEQHPGTFLYPLDGAVELARRVNARNWGPELRRRAAQSLVVPGLRCREA